MEDFQNWTNCNSLIHLSTNGSQYTWSNGRKGRGHIEKRLERVICNHRWLDYWNPSFCLTLTEAKFDRYLIMLEFHNNEAKHMIALLSSFKFIRMWTSHYDCINVVKNIWKKHVTSCPMFVLNQKLNFLTFKLKFSNKEVFNNRHHRVQTTVINLDNIKKNY